MPAIRLISFDKLVELKTFPRCPGNIDLTTELDKIDRDNSFLVFISHCWMRGYSGAEGWDGRPHPDNATGDKYRLCVKGIERLKNVMAPKMKECYVWLDFGCINQDGNPAGELEQLDKIVQCCDCIFTPIVDPGHANWSLPPTVYNYMAEYKAKLWNEGPYSYLNRGWCRVEMLYAANIPVQDNTSSDVKRHTLFEVGLHFHCKNNRRPHFLYGTKESNNDVVPILLPPLQHSYLTDYHPLKGNLSVASDMKHIETLIGELQPYLDANKIEVGYKGDRDSIGQRDGHGIHKYDSGAVYEGDFKKDRKHGQGKVRFPSGDVYEGGWKDDKKHGQGTYRYADGNVYEGEWENDTMHGRGVYRYSSGSSYEGDFKNDKMDGRGTFIYCSGEMYQGDWKMDKKCGYGTYHYASGDSFEGEWRNGVKHGRGVYRWKNGESCEGEWEDDEYIS